MDSIDFGVADFIFLFFFAATELEQVKECAQITE